MALPVSVQLLAFASHMLASPTDEALHASAALDLPAIERVVATRAPQVEASALELEVARSELRQSRLLPNPTLDLGWATIPVGSLNPPGLARPLANVPSYAVGLAYTFPVGKRAPGIRRAEAVVEASQAQLEGTARVLTLRLAGLLGELAVITLRRDGVRNLVEDAERAVHVAETRLASGFGAPLDLERLRIDLSRTEQQLRSADSDLDATLAACAGLVAMPCRGFTSSAEARRFLARWIDGATLPDGEVAHRPDLRALTALERAAAAEERLARARALPDPTVRLGYMHDRFTISGNQANSLNLGISVPLPIFDRGQALRDGARVKQARYAAERERRVAAGEARVQALLRRVEVQRARQRNLSAEILPRAQAMLADVERAADTRLVSLSDVIQARRTMNELLIEEADSYSDAFNAYLELLAEFPRQPQGAP